MLLCDKKTCMLAVKVTEQIADLTAGNSEMHSMPEGVI